MTLRFLPANRAWGVFFGSSLTGIGDSNRRIFNSLEEADAELSSCGLRRVRHRGEWKIEVAS